jgi:hypothetical protein
MTGATDARIRDLAAELESMRRYVAKVEEERDRYRRKVERTPAVKAPPPPKPRKRPPAHVLAFEPTVHHRTDMTLVSGTLQNVSAYLAKGYLEIVVIHDGAAIDRREVPAEILAGHTFDYSARMAGAAFAAHKTVDISWNPSDNLR